MRQSIVDSVSIFGSLAFISSGTAAVGTVSIWFSLTLKVEARFSFDACISQPQELCGQRHGCVAFEE